MILRSASAPLSGDTIDRVDLLVEDATVTPDPGGRIVIHLHVTHHMIVSVTVTVTVTVTATVAVPRTDVAVNRRASLIVAVTRKCPSVTHTPWRQWTLLDPAPERPLRDPNPHVKVSQPFKIKIF